MIQFVDREPPPKFVAREISWDTYAVVILGPIKDLEIQLEKDASQT